MSRISLLPHQSPLRFQPEKFPQQQLTMSKVTALLTIALLLFFTVTSAARPEPAQLDGKPLSESREGVKKVELVGESCEGVADMDGCLKKRTLTADIDYIYSVDP